MCSAPVWSTTVISAGNFEPTFSRPAAPEVLATGEDGGLFLLGDCGAAVVFLPEVTAAADSLAALLAERRVAGIFSSQNDVSGFIYRRILIGG